MNGCKKWRRCTGLGVCRAQGVDTRQLTLPAATRTARSRRDFNVTLLSLLASAGLWQQAGAASPVTQKKDQPQRLLVVGDSLSAEYGIQRGSGWVALLKAKLKAEGFQTEVINASISGETTSGGRSRLAALLGQHRAHVVVIELGGNDGLRGLPIKETRANLEAMVQASRAAGAQVVLIGVQVPPNYGRRYSDEFADMYRQLGRNPQVAAVLPFFLKGVADDADPLRWFQADRIHPNEAAQAILLQNVWPVLRPVLRPVLVQR